VYKNALSFFETLQAKNIKPSLFFQETNVNNNVSLSVTLPLFAGVSRVRALSPAWTGSPARETLISRTHLFLPHDIPPTKKIKYNKILTYI
jgi:hypothetical protein